jgi:CRISPR-associated protein Cmr6
MNWNNLKKPNIGLLFNKSIYCESDILVKLDKVGDELQLKTESKDFEQFYNILYQSKTSDLKRIRPIEFQIFTSIKLFTTYPGLLIGSGYQHDTGAEGDFKIGFFFDYTTGQPIISGSSLKGVLKSIFGSDAGVEQDLAAIHFIIDELAILKNKAYWLEKKEEITLDKLSTINNTIFGYEDIEGKVVFHDAIICPETSISEKYLSNDFITPHHNNPLKNPTPLMILKVLPNIAFDFAFDFSAMPENFIFSNDDLRCIFSQILITIGAGAKTNVGYGQFSETPYVKPKSGGQKVNLQGTSILDRIKEPPSEIILKMSKDTEFEGVIIEKKKENFLISIQVEENEVILKKKQDKFKGNLPPEIDKKVKVVFLDNYKFENQVFSVTIL